MADGLSPLVWALAGLFGSSFLSATLLPGSSEVVLLALVKHWPDWAGTAWLLASLGNTLGGMTSLWLGRRAPPPAMGRWQQRLQRLGPASLLFSWVPLVGDGLCLAAGWLRLPWLPCMLWMLLGKAARYAVLLWLLDWVMSL
uniref:YqaA family protein n=1 Tax=Leeia aquatica TaxID=2725557 RepID=UPI0035712757